MRLDRAEQQVMQHQNDGPNIHTQNWCVLLNGKGERWVLLKNRDSKALIIFFCLGARKKKKMKKKDQRGLLSGATDVAGKEWKVAAVPLLDGPGARRIGFCRGWRPQETFEREEA